MLIVIIGHGPPRPLNSGEKMRRLVPAKLSAAALVGVLATPAVAAPEPITSPYAQAAAEVRGSDGALLRAKNIDEVRKVGTGRFCAKVNDAVDVSKSIVQVELPSAYYRTYNQKLTTQCGNADNTITVATLDHSIKHIDIRTARSRRR
ncbi:hypothetical protein ACFU76_38885 [Streptomyces sp. NPDC057539]|uniref:hypothetical protein n=1 Tax=Streptomyces sp. NPDC057539 TaxID=3346159 RepID=UPI00367A3BD1